MCNHFLSTLLITSKHHHSDDQIQITYENLLYTVKRPYTAEMLDQIDEWMGLPKGCGGRDKREVMLSLYAIRYPDTLLIESLTDNAKSDIQIVSLPSLHSSPYSIWDEDTRKGLEKLGIMIPPR